MNEVCLVTVGRQNLLVSASDDLTFRIWDLLTGVCVQTIPVHHDSMAVAWVDDALASELAADVPVLDLNANLLGGRQQLPLATAGIIAPEFGPIDLDEQ